MYVSPSAISNWTHGRLPRRTPDDRRRTEAMEQVLRVRAGDLRLPLERDRADRGRTGPRTPDSGRSPAGEENPVLDLRERMVRIGGSDAYAVVAVEERILVGRDRHEHQRTVRLTLRALDPFTDCYRLIWTPDDGEARSEIVALDGCRKGRTLPGDAGLSGVELLFDHVLKTGSTHTFVYQERVTHSEAPQCWVRRGVGHSSVDRLTTVVRFVRPPARVWSCRWDERGLEPIDRTPATVVDGTATLQIPHPTPGLHGLTWDW